METEGDELAGDQNGPPPGDESTVQARLDAVLARHGEQLDEGQKMALRQPIEGLLATERALREVPLDNGDEPEIVFVPYRANGDRR
jgi:hypothetical protein